MFRLVCVLVFSICDLVHELVRIYIYIYIARQQMIGTQPHQVMLGTKLGHDGV